MTNQSVDIEALCQKARQASWDLQSVNDESKNKALRVIKDLLEEHKEDIYIANELDKEEAHKLIEVGKLSKALYKRLDIKVYICIYIYIYMLYLIYIQSSRV